MRNKKLKLIIGILTVAAGLALFKGCLKHKSPDNEIIKEIHPVIGAIQNIISTTGTVLPKNRLEVKPPVNGRIEKILVQEGDKVTAGQVLALMSSTERAALLDAARAKGRDSVEYWQDVYKAISLISPIGAEVIVATTQPGQTVTANDAVVVLSDRLIIRAQVDETDIGKISLRQDAVITLDAYPDVKKHAKVDHIYYESKLINNVTIYEVDLFCENLPEFFRSGMNASVDFKVNSKEKALVIPLEAVSREKDGTYVWVKPDNKREAVKRAVALGISDDKNIEVISGLSAGDTVVMKIKKYMLPKNNNTGSNPFTTFGRRRGGR
ncbi:MAG: HlyD family efflux transporter periplasmic adaptor subunit [Candidatus Omnitrophica bacterium]|nr:HlyD family efflux transporter periplasmic adaptor subunit [Candidatus Omnitrophota bacterium]MBU4478611.1 HlyD family efflux transporter periplasmic adaptor subunit [Candidatus Omnitrophota bacterium]